MERIKDTVKNLIQAWESKKGSQAGDDPAALLKKALSRKELAHVSFHYFRNGIMGLKVDSSTRLYFLNSQKDKLLVRLRKYSGSAIKDIRFSIGEIK